MWLLNDYRENSNLKTKVNFLWQMKQRYQVWNHSTVMLAVLQMLSKFVYIHSNCHPTKIKH